MARYKIISDGDNFYTILGVPIFEMHTDRGFPCDQAWMDAAIKNHLVYKERDYRPTIIVGHNVKGQEKGAVGFLDNLVLRGKRLYADLVRVPKEIKEKIVANSFPSRSVEILPKSKRILTLALLGGTTPHFTLPQMAYENEELGLWYRSPEEMLTEEQKKEIFEMVGKSVGEAVPEALATFFSSEDDGDTITVTDGETGEVYAIPAQLLKGLKAAGKIGAGVAKRAAGVVKKHPFATAAGGIGAASLAIGRSKRGQKIEAAHRREAQGYAIDEETGAVYFDGEPLGMVLTYDEMAEVGLQVPEAVKKPHKLPVVGEESPQLTVDESAVGVGTGTDTGLEEQPGKPGAPFVQPLGDDTSEQFEDEIVPVIYDLQQEVGQLKVANALMKEGRRAEEYTRWLTEQKEAGTPVGNIEETVEFLMTQNDEQVEQFKELIQKQPKVAFEKTEGGIEASRTYNLQTETDIKADFEKNKETYLALGVSEKDLKYARFVSSNIGLQGT